MENSVVFTRCAQCKHFTHHVESDSDDVLCILCIGCELDLDVESNQECPSFKSK